MKKLLGILICTATLVGSAFAIDFSIGGRAFLGTDLDTNATLKENVASVSANSNFDFGFGAYTNLTLIGGLGVQAEANLTRGKTSFNTTNDAALGPKDASSELEIWTLDIPLMVWFKGDLGKHFQLGVGAGPNFGFNIPAGNFRSIYESTSADIKNNIFNIGVCVGADAKFFFNDHLGLVLGARYINDFKKTDVPVKVAGLDGSYPTVAITRKALYGNVGLEYKFF